MNTETIKKAMIEKGYDYCSVIDAGKYFVINAQPAQMKNNRFQLGDCLRSLGMTVSQHYNYLDTEIAHASQRGAE